GMGNDRSGDSLGVVGFLRLDRFFGSSFGTTMVVSCWRMRVGKPEGAACQEGIGKLEVSPTGSIPRRESPARQVANDNVEDSRAMLTGGQEAPAEIRPLTRGTRYR